MVTMPLVFTYEIFLGGAWVDVTEWVRQDPATRITRGAGAEDDQLRPQEAAFTLDNADDRFNPRNPMGPYFGLLVRNAPCRIRAWPASTPGVQVNRFYGEVVNWQPQWNEDRSNCVVPIMATGITRRLRQTGNVTPWSSLRRWANNHTGLPTVVGYWPLEDPPGSDQGVPDIGTVSAQYTPFSRSREQTWGKGEMNDWLPNTLAMFNNDELHVPCDIRGTFVDTWDVSFTANSEDADASVVATIDCGTTVWQILVDWGTSTMKVTRPEGTEYFVSALPDPFYKGTGPMAFVFRQYVSGGGSTGWLMRGSVTGQGSINLDSVGSARALGPIRSITLHTFGGDNDTVSVGSLMVSHRATSNAGLSEYRVAAQGFDSERVSTRFQRLGDDNGIPVVPSHSSNGYLMGRQFTKPVLDHLEECARTGVDNVLYESRDAAGLRLDMNPFPPRSATFTVSYGKAIAPLLPVEDDRLTVNDVTVESSSGGQTRVVKETGTLSVDEVGRYARKHEANLWPLYGEGQDLAPYLLAAGTYAGPRFPEVSLKAGALSDADYRALMLVPGIGYIMTLTDLDAAGFPDDIKQLVIGYEEEFNPYHHVITYTGVPHEVLANVPPLVSDLRLDSEDSTLAAGATSTATSLSVVTTGALWSDVDQPFDVMASGERMTVTAVALAALNSNPYFETDVAGWSASGGTFVRSTAQAHEGVASGLLTPSGVDAFTAAFVDVPASPGFTYTAQAWVRSPTGYSSVKVSADWRKGAGVGISSISTTVDLAVNTWTLVSVSGTAPALTNEVRMNVWQDGTPTSSDTLYVDEAMVTGTAQTFTVTRSVNGVVKALPSGASVSLFPPQYIQPKTQ